MKNYSDDTKYIVKEISYYPQSCNSFEKSKISSRINRHDDCLKIQLMKSNE